MIKFFKSLKLLPILLDKKFNFQCFIDICAVSKS